MAKEKGGVTCSIGEKEMLTVEEAEAYTGVSRDTLTEWRNEGLPYYRRERRIWFWKQDLLNFMLAFERVGGR